MIIEYLYSVYVFEHEKGPASFDVDPISFDRLL